MASFNGLAVGLSSVFGCLLLLAFAAAQVYFLLWRKKRSSIPNANGSPEDHAKYAKELLHQMFLNKSSSLPNDLLSGNRGNACTTAREVGRGEGDLEMGSSNGKEVVMKFPGEESADSELMRLHGLAGPPRFLFTIKEETKEDLESDDGKSRGDRSRKASRTRSLSDVVLAIDTPFLTPLASPSRGFSFNPLFESPVDIELGGVMSSPPPKFKFLRDAEEKLRMKLKEAAARRALELSSNRDHSEEAEGGQILAIIVGRDGAKEVIRNLPQFPSSSSQVLPLTSSPSATTFRLLDKGIAVP
ncbi:hypothetical protein MLD38_040121 [Melastoma candidum]|uniref:Uncharacterized protein n=1 Tax=Melastoma candidum TaxID=119954 RepID=A0ACB9L5V4_9MYRT|nr:hypothetical protein MLD38_040121 [Melastoma candidum]